MKQSYAVETTFTLHVKFFVKAENEDDARKLVEENCYRIHPKVCTKLPLDEVGWDFSLVYNNYLTVDSVTATKDKCFAVESCFTDSGTFWVNAENEEEARELIEKKCGQKLCSKIQSDLPRNKISWKFARKPQVTTGKVFLQEQE